jgi:protein-ribulosamine 3-kinase
VSDPGVPRYADPDAAIRSIYGPEVTVQRRSPVAGGCISNGTRLDLSDGTSLFMKESRRLPPGMFRAEAQGLGALRSDHVRVPQPLAYGQGERYGFVLMEWIDSGSKRADFDTLLGAGLAELHRGRQCPRAGFDGDNYIGSTPQENPWTGSWIAFFREHRIGFQLRLAVRRNRLDGPSAKGIERLMQRLEELLPEVDQKSILHGDLWGGNVMVGSDGGAVLIDPAVYYGHREADLAMTELFGGFSRRFYDAYREAWPLVPGYSDRRDLYNLYHLLNHLNIFGGSYLSSVNGIVARYR